MWATPDRDQRCRTCGFPRETLPHVTCHCMACSALYQARHDAVVARVRTAAADRFTVAYENRPLGDTTLRPDPVLVSGEEALVVDVACPFDNTPTAFGERPQREAAEVRARRRLPPPPVPTGHDRSRRRGRPRFVGPG
ncbi:hypothetical protein MTO96_029586 [Rhipicephalus appendiculatus]